MKKKIFFGLDKIWTLALFSKNSKTLCSKFIYNRSLDNVLVISFDQSFGLWCYFKSTSIESRWKGCAFMCVLEKCKNVNIRQLKDRKRKMPLLGIELLTFRLGVQCLHHWAIWEKILCDQKLLNKNTFTYRGTFAIYTINSL